MSHKVSAVLIVKDGAKTIKRCIESLGGLDEVLIYDTGSTDGTQDICRKLSATVAQAKEVKPFHFGSARNAAMDHAKHAWILTIDADEILREGSLSAIRNALAAPSKDGYKGVHLNYPPDATEKDTSLPTSRVLLFRKVYWTWKRRIHERLFATTNAVKTKKLGGLVIEHRPTGDRSTRRDQNLELLKISVQEEPDHIFAFLQLGLEYIHREEWKEAVEPLRDYIRIDQCEGFLGRGAARMHLARALARSGDLQGAMNEFVGARQDAPGRREPLYWASVELIRAGLLPDAVWWLEEALKIAPRETPAFSLYSADAQGNLIKDTIRECRHMMKEADAKRVS